VAVAGVGAAKVLGVGLAEQRVALGLLLGEVWGFLGRLERVGLGLDQVTEHTVAHRLAFVGGLGRPAGRLVFVLRDAEPAGVVERDDGHGAGVPVLGGLVHPGERHLLVVLDLEFRRGVGSVT